MRDPPFSRHYRDTTASRHQWKALFWWWLDKCTFIKGYQNPFGNQIVYKKAAAKMSSIYGVHAEGLCHCTFFIPFENWFFFFSFLGRNEIENVNWIRRASNCCLRQAISCYSFFFLFDLFRWWATRETSEDWLLNVAVANIPNTGLILKETRRSTHTQNTRTHCRRTPERNKWHRLMIFGRTFVRQNVDYPQEF